MKKVMKFVKGKREDETQVKNISIESKKIVNDKLEDNTREDDFISRDKSITKLHKAVWNENSDKLKSIIKTHDIDITDKLDRTALYFAVLKNNPNIVNLLLENSANQNIPDIDGITPFLKSVQLGYKQCASILLNYGADLKKTDKDLNSCVHFAIMAKDIEMLSFLLTYNADSNLSNVNGEYPLHIAIQMQNIQMIEVLLNNNADINITNASGFTPLMLAQEHKNSEIITLLENHLQNSKENILFPNDISTASNSHKSSYENVSNPKSNYKPEPEVDTWNDSPVLTPTKIKSEKSLTKLSKHFFNEETDITEEKSESDVSIKCSENTSPQSGIIPPPCKPLRSLEYLQSMENRPVHLLTLGTVRTRHISMTESDHSKNNTPHRYSYQGDFQGDTLNKHMEHFSAADEKGDSVNISVKSKLFSKLECDSTVQSDWGSNESLPLDEISSGGRKEKSSKNNLNSASSDKSTDIFLQKQFSLLEDYEKNREKRYSVSYEMDLLKKKDNLDIDNLLEDNNRINAQLEKYAGQSDSLVRITKSKSLPRNCEPYSSYHKGSFSLPRTLEAGKDPFRDMRAYSYFKPRSHFSFSLKMLKGDKKSGFIDKLKNMFNKKSQIHLTEQENGTWLYKKTDNECIPTKNSDRNMTDNLPSISINNFSPELNKLEEDSFSSDLSVSNNEQNQVIENQILSLNNMNREDDYSKQPSCSQFIKCKNEQCSFNGEDLKLNRQKCTAKKTSSNIHIEEIFCEECSEFLHQKLTEVEQNISNKDNFISLLQDQLKQLKDRNIRSINEAQDINLKYGVAQQELISLRHICGKYDEEIQKLRHEKSHTSNHDQVLAKFKEEAEKWKKQYEDLIAQINLGDNATIGEGKDELKIISGSSNKPKEINNTDEENLRKIIQNEVATAVNILQENSQTLISSLEKQNKKLESLVDRLQKDLDASILREKQLKDELDKLKNQLADASHQTEKIKNDYDKSYEDTIKTIQVNNEKLKTDLNNITKLYTDLQKQYSENINKTNKDTKLLNEINDEFSMVKDEYRSLTKSLSNISEEIVKVKENALVKNEELRQQIAEMGATTNMKTFINKITESLESMEMTELDECKVENLGDQAQVVSNSISDIEKINEINSEIQVKLEELKSNKTISSLEEENQKLKEDMSKKCDNLLNQVKESNEEVEILNIELKKTNDVIRKQCNKMSSLNDVIEREIRKNCLLDLEIAKQKNSSDTLNKENEELKEKVVELENDNKSIEAENSDIKSSLNDVLNINEDLNKKFKDALSTVDEMKKQVDLCHEKMDKLEKENNELTEKINILKMTESKDDLKIKEYEEKLNNSTKEIKILREQLDEEKENAASLTEKLKTSAKEIKILQDEFNTKNQIVVSLQEKTDNAITENKILQEQLDKEKENIASLKKHIESLQFYHDNEMKANNARFEELEIESNTKKLNLQTEIDELTNLNTLLQQKLDDIENENKHLLNKIEELNQEINSLNEKLNNVNILPDPQKYVDTLDVINQENIEMKTAMTELSEILEEKFTEKPTDYNDVVKKDSEKKNTIRSVKSKYSDEEQIITIDLNPETCGANVCRKITTKNNKDPLVQRVNSIERKIDELVDTVSTTSADVKSTSLPNLSVLEKIKSDSHISEKRLVVVEAEFKSIVKKSSSLDFIIGKKDDVTDCCKNRWEKHLESIHQLRTELTEILEKLDERKIEQIPLTDSATKKYSEKYKEVLNSLQRQVNELQVKTAKESSKSYGLEEEMKGLKVEMIRKSQMEDEIYQLRRELYKQKVERIKDTEIAKIKREAELFAVQQQLKFEYLESKKKLLADLSAVQIALIEKNKEEMQIKQRCDELVKEVTASQQARKKKLQNISFTGVRQPTDTTNQITIYDVVHPSLQEIQNCKPQCSGIAQKSVKPQALVINVRKKLSETIEKHRLDTDSEQSNADEELKKKYLLQ